MEKGIPARVLHMIKKLKIGYGSAMLLLTILKISLQLFSILFTAVDEMIHYILDGLDYSCSEFVGRVIENNKG